MSENNSETKTGYVYALHNEETGEYYIGSTGNLQQRVRKHLKMLEKGVHHCKPLQEAYNNNPNFNLESIAIPPSPEARLEALAAEDILLSSSADDEKRLNVARSVYAPRLGLSFSEETRAKMSETYIRRNGEGKANPGLTFKGHQHSEEEKQRRSEIFKERMAQRSPEERAAWGQKGIEAMSVPVQIGDNVYPNQVAAAKAEGVPRTTLMVRLKSPNFPDWKVLDK